MTAADLCVNSTTGIENKRERPLLVVQSQQAPPSVCPELDVRGSSNQAAGQLTVVTGNNVPIADNHCLWERPFVATAGQAEAVTQISGSFSLTGRAASRFHPFYSYGC